MSGYVRSEPAFEQARAAGKLLSVPWVNTMKAANKPGSKALVLDQASFARAKRRVLRESSAPSEDRDRVLRKIILSIPSGKVSTYGKVAAAAGYPLHHRAVARLLRTELPDMLPWHRVVGAGGEIKLPGEAAGEQRTRLQMESVQFREKRVDMGRFEAKLRPWEVWE